MLTGKEMLIRALMIAEHLWSLLIAILVGGIFNQTTWTWVLSFFSPMMLMIFVAYGGTLIIRHLRKRLESGVWW